MCVWKSIKKVGYYAKCPLPICSDNLCLQPVIIGLVISREFTNGIYLSDTEQMALIHVTRPYSISQFVLDGKCVCKNVFRL